VIPVFSGIIQVQRSIRPHVFPYSISFQNSTQVKIPILLPGEIELITVFIDGGSRKNPGEAAVGMVVYDSNGNELLKRGKRIGIATNNESEYTALIEALRYILNNFRFEEAVIYSDSELIVKQIHGVYRVKSFSLTPLYNESRRLMKKLPQVQLVHVKRNLNKKADWIVNRVLDNEPCTDQPYFVD